MADVTDEQVIAALRAALESADMSTATERQLRKDLEEKLGTDLSDRKKLIRSEIELFLSQPADGDGEDGGEAGEEESDADPSADEEQPVKKRRQGGGLGSALSPEMQAFLGCESLPRPQVVKQIWAYIRKHELQNPKDKRKIILDDKLKTIFSGSVTMFSMNKQLSRHVWAADSKGEAEEDKPRSKEAKPSVKRKKQARNNDSSDDEGSVQPKKRKGNSGFTKQMHVSEDLSDWLGGKQTISRPELTSFFWSYVKEHQLQDPSNKQFILADEKLKQLTGEARFSGFGFSKYLNKHLSPVAAAIAS